MREIEIVDWIRARGVGIGDDCAIFRPRANQDLLFTTDQMIEGVHFRSNAPAARVGERALARSLSDIAAMGGEPRFCLVALATPADHERWIKSFYRGLLGLAERFGVALAGGDLACDRRMHCDVMVCGAVGRGRALKRDGARVGDAIYVSGPLGRNWDRKIQPRLALGQSLTGRATACIDVSDGLSIDLYRLCAASKVAAEIERVPIARGATLQRAWNGGEDYELLFTMPGRLNAPPGTTKIGEIVRGKPGAISFQGRALKPRGYEHFK